VQTPTKILAGLCLLIAASASADSSPVSVESTTPSQTSVQRAAITAQYGQMNDAFVQGDIARLVDVLAPDYTELDPGGKILDRKALSEKLMAERNEMDSITTQLTITNVAPTSNGVLVDARMHNCGTGSKKVLFFTVHGRFVNDMIVEDFWTNGPTGWRLASRHTLFDQSKQFSA